MSSHYVYVIVNKINLKLYFGSHSWEGTGVDPNYYGSGKIIKQAVKKYGKDNFIIQPIKFYDTVEECRKAEEELLNKYNIADNPYCYNLKNSAIGSEKGKNNPMYGKHHTDATRRKMSQASKGRALSDEHKQKISRAKKGEKHPNYGKRGKGTPMYGKHHTEETRQKLSQAKKGENNPMYGRTRTENTRNKIAIANGGKPLVAIKDGKIKIFTSQMECSRVLGLHHSAINSCLKGRRKSHKGYAFNYLEQLESGIYEGFTGIAE